MLLTPEQARKETCPLIRYCINYAHVVNDGASAVHEHGNCNGPDCKVGWRWATPPGETKETGGLGYCGAFGRPE